MRCVYEGGLFSVTSQRRSLPALQGATRLTLPNPPRNGPTTSDVQHKYQRHQTKHEQQIPLLVKACVLLASLGWSFFGDAFIKRHGDTIKARLLCVCVYIYTQVNAFVFNKLPVTVTVTVTHTHIRIATVSQKVFKCQALALEGFGDAFIKRHGNTIKARLDSILVTPLRSRVLRHGGCVYALGLFAYEIYVRMHGLQFD
jgi:hypothetical protein